MLLIVMMLLSGGAKRGVTMRVVNRGVCREGLVDVVFGWSYKC